MNKNEFEKFRINNEADFKNINLNEIKDDKNENLKISYLKKIGNFNYFKDMIAEENFQKLIVYLIGKEIKDEIDSKILNQYLIYLDDLADMLKTSNDEFIQIIKSIAANLSAEHINKDQLIFRQGI